MNRRRNRKAISTLALLALLQLASPAWAADSINLRGGVHKGANGNANRLVFDFPRAPKYDLKQEGERVELTFAGELDFKQGASARKLSRLADFTSRIEDGRTIASFRVAPGAKVAHFLSGSYVVVDVSGAVPPKAAPAATAPTAAEQLTALTKAENGPKVILGEATPAFAPTAAPAAVPEQVTLGTLDVPATVDSLPVAIFQRGGNAYIVFDRRVKLKPAAGAPAVSVIDGGAFTGYRLPAGGKSLAAVRTDKQWRLQTISDPKSESITPKIEPHYALGARVLMPLTAEGTPPVVVSFIDPVVGDTLFVVPLAGAEGVSRARQLVDFDLLPSQQGIVVRPLNDQLTLRSMPGGIEITAPNGIRLTDAGAVPEAAQAQPAFVAPNVDTAAAQKIFFALDEWRQRHDESYDNARTRLQLAVAAAPEDARNKARLDLARLYLANGFGKEARGMLSLMAGEEEAGLEDLAGQQQYKLLMAAAEMLSGNPQAAQPVFASPDVADYDDVKLWHAASLAAAHQFAEAAPLFDATGTLLKTYPEPLFRQFALLAAETYIALGDYPKATAAIDLLLARTKGSVLHEPQVMYLRGVLQSRTGTFDSARKLWEEAAAGRNQLERVRARFALIDLDLVTKNINPAEAAAQLERLRFGWRGDDLELMILNRLSDIYVQSNQPEEALRTLDRVKVIFPNTDRDAEATDKQRRIFRDFFAGGDLDRLSPLKVLSFYNKYKQYAPTDPAESRVIADKLVSRMLSMDLLPQAATLLSQRVALETDPAAKAKLGAQLAGIRLLDRAPEQAIAALDQTEGAYDTTSATERKLLRARALADQGKFDAALALLNGDTSEAALRLTATTAWQAKQWAVAAGALAALLPNPPAGTMGAEQAQIVVNRAVALSLAGDQAGVTRLAADFGPAMKPTAQSSVFAMLTDPDKGAANLASLGAQARGVDFFQGFLENYRK